MVPSSPARSEPSVAAIRSGLRALLDRAATAAADDVRRYPTPIAGCDLQLPALLEARSRLIGAIAEIDALPDRESAEALATLTQCARSHLAPADAVRVLAQAASLGAQWRARPGACGPDDSWAGDGGAA